MKIKTQKLKFKEKTQSHFVSFDKIFYLQKEGDFQSDFLFKQATLELNLSPAFEYQMSFFKNENKYFIFLTHIKNLSKASFCYPQPLIFSTLYKENFIKEKNFAVLLFEENFTFFCFYQNAKLNSVRNIPQFSLKDLSEKEQKEEFFSQMLFEQGRILELFEYNKSEILLSFKDLFDFGGFFTQKTQKTHAKLESLLKENALETLSVLSSKHLDNDANFIKNEKTQVKFTLKALLVFLGFFALSLAFLLLLDYPKYKQNEATKLSNENLQNELLSLDLKTQNLSKELEKLGLLTDKNKEKLRLKEEILTNLKENFYPQKNRIFILAKIIEILNENALKISHLSLENNELECIFNDKENLNKALNIFEEQKNFKILEKDENTYHLKLGFNDG